MAYKCSGHYALLVRQMLHCNFQFRTSYRLAAYPKRDLNLMMGNPHLLRRCYPKKNPKPYRHWLYYFHRNRYPPCLFRPPYKYIAVYTLLLVLNLRE